MADWWRSLSFKRQAFIIMAVAIGAAIVLLEFLIEPIMEDNFLVVAGGIDWHEAPFWLLVVFVVAAGVVAVLTRMLMRRLTRLSRATEEIVRGNFAFRMPVPGNPDDVFNKLASNFNTMAETIDELLYNERRLLTDISHELRSPLARLSAIAELLLMRNPDNKNTLYLSKAGRELAHMSQLVNVLLGQSGARLARHEGRETIDVSAIAEDMAEGFRMRGALQRKELYSDIEPGVRVDGHPAQIRLVIENLLDNALFYTPPDSRVELRLSHFGEDARLTVRDHGPGVPEEFLGLIFRPFFRVDPSRGRHSGGVGLGLALVSEACHELGGKVAAKNAQPGLEVSALLLLARKIPKG